MNLGIGEWNNLGDDKFKGAAVRVDHLNGTEAKFVEVKEVKKLQSY